MTILRSLQEIAAHSGASAELGAGPFERAFVRYSVGTGTYRVKGSKGYIIVNGDMYRLDGTRDGYYEAVFEAQNFDPSNPYQPTPSKPPYDAPSPVPPVIAKDVNPTKAKFSFERGAFWGPGPAPATIQLLKDGGAQFWVSAGAVITGGDGIFDGVVGQECSLGGTYLPQVPPQLTDGTSFDATVTHSFRIVLARDLA